MLNKQQIFDLIKSGAQPSGFGRDTGRNAFKAACKVIEKIKEVNNVPSTSPKPGGE